MKTSIIGFPRIGADRELKFATEKFFKGEISEEELRGIASDIRRRNWILQKEAGIDYIPSNDFSFYDNVLDTAVLFNLIPKRFSELGLSELETYFALARGYQGEKGNVKALAMKKWFNTNYHYIVPEIDDDTHIELTSERPLDEYREALRAGVETKVTLIGPFTLLKLARYTGSREIADYVCHLAKEYFKLVARLELEGVKWIQFDEPYLVRDLTFDDIEIVKKIYNKILPAREHMKVLLQTYFGDIRDIYDELIKLDIDGIGLDFLEGKKTAELVLEKGLPEGRILFAGLVNGKNIWRNNYKKTVDLLKTVQEKLGGEDSIVLSTSCSLLHVPFTTENETKLDSNVLKHFAFAKEKLGELSEIAGLADKALSGNDIHGEKNFADNQALFISREGSIDEAVRERTANIGEEAFTRLPVFEERERLQKTKLRLPEYPTTTIGSFPQTSDVRRTRRAFRNGEITKDDYIEFNKKKIEGCIRLQEELGLDVLVHGEYERNDMVEYFGEHLSGYIFTDKAWVQSYGTRCVKPPVIWGDVSRREPITVEWSVYAASLTDKPVKGMLTGPVTILNWSFPREDISIKESTIQIALAIRDEVQSLEEAGIDIIQIDEAALREKLPLRRSDWYSEYLDWAIPAFRLVHSGVKPETQIHTHMCYSEFTDIIPAIDAMDADVITFEVSRSDLQILDSLKENNFKTEVGPGVYDIHSPRVPSVDELVNSLRKMLEKVEPGKLWINPDCGLKTRGEKEVRESLANLVEAAKRIRENDR